MEQKKATTAKSTAPRYKKADLASSERFAGKKDLINALLDDSACCTVKEAEDLINKFLKGKVK